MLPFSPDQVAACPMTYAFEDMNDQRQQHQKISSLSSIQQHEIVCEARLYTAKMLAKYDKEKRKRAVGGDDDKHQQEERNGLYIYYVVQQQQQQQQYYRHCSMMINSTFDPTTSISLRGLHSTYTECHQLIQSIYNRLCTSTCTEDLLQNICGSLYESIMFTHKRMMNYSEIKNRMLYTYYHWFKDFVNCRHLGLTTATKFMILLIMHFLIVGVLKKQMELVHLCHRNAFLNELHRFEYMRLMLQLNYQKFCEVIIAIVYLADSMLEDCRLSTKHFHYALTSIGNNPNLKMDDSIYWIRQTKDIHRPIVIELGYEGFHNPFIFLEKQKQRMYENII